MDATSRSETFRGAKHLPGFPASSHQALYRKTFNSHVISNPEGLPGCHVHSVYNIAIIYFTCAVWACLLPLA